MKTTVAGGATGLAGVTISATALAQLLADPTTLSGLYTAATEHKANPAFWRLLGATIGMVLSGALALLAALFHPPPGRPEPPSPSPAAPPQEITVATQFETQIADALKAALPTIRPQLVAGISAIEGGMTAFLANAVESVAPKSLLGREAWGVIKPAIVAELQKIEAANPGSVIEAALEHDLLAVLGG